MRTIVAALAGALLVTGALAASPPVPLVKDTTPEPLVGAAARKAKGPEPLAKPPEDVGSAEDPPSIDGPPSTQPQPAPKPAAPDQPSPR